MEIILYKLLYAKDALEDRDFWAKSGNKVVIRKITEMLKSIKENPKKGIGNAEQYSQITNF